MYETGAPWTLTAADGTTVTFNDGTMVLEEVTGFDAPTVRQNVEELPEADGAVAGAFYFGARPVTLRGRIVNVSAAARNQAVAQLQRSLRGLREDVTLESSPQGLPAMQAYGRLQSFRVSGGFVKEFLIGLVCADPRIYSQEEHVVAGIGQVATSGAVFPWVFDVSFGGGSGATVTVVAENAGNFDVAPLVRVTGPIVSPQVKNLATGESVYLDNVTLAAGEFVEFDMQARMAVRGDGTNLYDRVRFPGSVWWSLEPGANSVELRSASASASDASLSVVWRDSWV